MARILNICPLCGARITCEDDAEHQCVAYLRNDDDGDSSIEFYWGTCNCHVKN